MKISFPALAAVALLGLVACDPPPLIEEPVALDVATEALPAAVVGLPFGGTVQAQGGKPPYTFALADVPAELLWLAIDGANGEVSGTPPAVLMPGIYVTLVVTDAKGDRVERAFRVQVLECGREGAQNDCFSAAGGQCLQSTVLCSSGRLPTCAGGSPSLSTSRCGDGCNSCSATAADRCDGSCRCGGGPACQGAAGTCCGGNCADPANDPANCGACGTVCPGGGPANSHPACLSGTCGSQCDTGYTRCGGACVDTSGDPQHCGGCGAVCAQVCNGGACGPACNAGAGYVNCGGSCTQTASDPDHCGGCGTVCPAAPAGFLRTCVAGQCGTACAPGLTNCGGACVNLQTSTGNCGGCGVVCPVGPVGSSRTCSAGTCDWFCPSTRPYCVAFDACVTLQTCYGDPGTCFVAGTPVLLADGGSRAIEAVAEGDEVLAFDVEDGTWQVGRVMKVLVHPDTPQLVVVNHDLVTTPEHPFFVDGGWRRADELRLGDRLTRAEVADGGFVARTEEVVSLEARPGGVTTYNLEVAPWHVYFAGGVLVHNIKQIP